MYHRKHDFILSEHARDVEYHDVQECRKLMTAMMTTNGNDNIANAIAMCQRQHDFIRQDADIMIIRMLMRLVKMLHTNIGGGKSRSKPS